MDKNKLLLAIVLASSLLVTQANEYIYPVVRMEYEGDSIIGLLFQKEGGLELLSWNSSTKEVGKILSSRFIPTDIQVLPDKSGFSFIDQGVIWVKSFLKRSPRPLDIPSPLCDIDLIFWKNGQSCYFSARQDDRYSLFELDLQGNLDCLVSSDKADCIYPQKINETLFFLSKSSVDNTYQLMKTDYPAIYHGSSSFNSTFNFDQRVEQLFNNFRCAPEARRSLSECPSLYTFENNVSFLKMVSESEGFILGHPPTICADNSTYCYYHLTHQEGIWSCSLLFSFSLPLDIIKPSVDSIHHHAWLYESILPFLPLFVSETRQLYYTHFFEDSFGLYCYSLEDGGSLKVSLPDNRFYFSPLCIEDQLVYGGTIDTTISKLNHDNDPPCMWLNDRGCVCLNLYQLDLQKKDRL